MKIAIYYKHRYGGVYRHIKEIQERSKHLVKVVSNPSELEGYDVVHSYSDCYGGIIHTAECNMLQATDYARRFSKYAVKYFIKGLNELYRLRVFDKIIVKSERDFNFLNKFNFNLSLIREGVDLNKFQPRDVVGLKEKLCLKDKKVVLFVGRVEKAKGINLLLRTVTYLPKNWILVVIGKKTGKNQELRTSEKERVLFLGSLPHEELVDYYNIANVFCLPSWTECFPLTVLEALACGTPVVATDVGDIKKIINPPIGGFICDFDSRDIAKKILDADKRITSINTRKLASKYPWWKTVRKIERVWEDCYAR